METLKINGLNAYETYGIRMGDDFLDAIGTPASAKDYIENDSPLENGTQLLMPSEDGSIKLSSRTLTLTFVISGNTHDEYINNKAAFFSILSKGEITIQVLENGEEVYHLWYDKSTSFAQDVARTSCKLAVQFTEPNPANRT